MSGFPSTAPPSDPMPALITDAALKGLLGITTGDTDTQVTFANNVASQLIREETGRFLSKGQYVDTFIPPHDLNGFFSLAEMPLANVVSVKKGASTINFKIQHLRMSTLWIENAVGSENIEITYEAGFDPLPYDLQSVLLELARRQLVSMGVDPGAGTAAEAPVKAVTVGSLRVDYAVSAGSQATTGVSPVLRSVLDQYQEVLTRYMSTRLVAATP